MKMRKSSWKTRLALLAQMSTNGGRSTSTENTSPVFSSIDATPVVATSSGTLNLVVSGWVSSGSRGSFMATSPAPCVDHARSMKMTNCPCTSATPVPGSDERAA